MRPRGAATNDRNPKAIPLVRLAGGGFSNLHRIRRCAAPSLPEFRAMCLPKRVPLCHQNIAGRADLAYIALPLPALTPEKREECLEKMRAALKPAPPFPKGDKSDATEP